jgi:uncharacterized protein YlxW (UPF0749 family)
MRLPALRRPAVLGGLTSGPTWKVLVPVVCLVAGFGFAVSARESRGTELRAPGTADLRDLVASAEGRVRAADAELAALQRQVDAATRLAGRGDSAVARTQARTAPLLEPGGLTAVHGPGLIVTLDDAPESAATAGVDPNQLVVHQDDLQSVVNALWAGGAEAMSIAGQRVIATSAVRCVGNTLLLNGDVYSPPFEVAAIGPARTMSAALNASPGVRLFEQAASYYGLGYSVETADDVQVPKYQGSVALRYARPLK